MLGVSLQVAVQKDRKFVKSKMVEQSASRITCYPPPRRHLIVLEATMMGWCRVILVTGTVIRVLS